MPKEVPMPNEASSGRAPPGAGGGNKGWAEGGCGSQAREGKVGADVFRPASRLHSGTANGSAARYISHRSRRVKVPLVVGHKDRHITIHTLNQLLSPAFEIRVCVDFKTGRIRSPPP